MIYAGVIIGLVIVLLGIVVLGLHLKGGSLPVEHTTFVVIRLECGADKVWPVIADAARQPEWQKSVTKVEKLPDRNGHTVWMQSMGRNSFTLEEVVSDPPRRLVREIVDNKGPFSGSWEYLLIPVPAGEGKQAVKVRLTERGKVHATIPRAIMHFFGEDMYLKKYLSALAAKMGEQAKFSND